MSKYIGNKNIPGILQSIINQIPVHKTYVELFAGSAAVARNISGATVYVINDLSKDAPMYGIEHSHSTVHYHNKHFIQILQSHIIQTASTDTFLFIDPPYLFSTRYSDSYYQHELSDKDHFQLLSEVKSLNCNVMIIHPVCQLYDQVLQSWRSVQLKIRYNRKTSIEKLYMNYPPQLLQSSKFIGKDCWQRQGYKRKARRHQAKSLIIDLPEFDHLKI